MERVSRVYMLASRRNETLYTGSTTDLARRIWEHRIGALPGFTRDYGVTMLVWYEAYPRIVDAQEQAATAAPFSLTPFLTAEGAPTRMAVLDRPPCDAP
jgi:predicted GIY-YIG superfamily endonuclease